MAYYMNPKKKKETSQPGKQAPGQEKRPFYQLLGCVIVLVIFFIIWLVRH